MTFIAIIPARYASTRFPGKPLALLGGKPVVQHVWERAEASLGLAYVATDDQRIYDAVVSFGGRAVMTSPNHRSGTERCLEAYRKIAERCDVVVNIQGDEPFITPQQIETLKQCFADPTTQIATLARPFKPEEGIDALLNPNSPKVIVDNQQRAKMFSRSPIPYLRDVPQSDWLSAHTYLKHIGLYAYRTETLEEIVAMPPEPTEQAESLEQLRWLMGGKTIKVGLTDQETIGIDTPEDLSKAERFLAPTKTHVFNVVVLDRSGSMELIRKGAISGVNETIGAVRAAQKKYSATQEHYFTLATFCSCGTKLIYDRTPIDQVELLTPEAYRPCCGTPLYDAMGFTINNMRSHVEGIADAVVLFTVITDGEENASHEFHGRTIRTLVETLQGEGWSFTYMGANQNSMEVALRLSIKQSRDFGHTDADTLKAMRKDSNTRTNFYSRLHEARCQSHTGKSLSKRKMTELAEEAFEDEQSKDNTDIVMM